MRDCTWDHKILLPGEPEIRNGGDRVTAHPLWVSRDLSLLGTDPPFVDAVLIAAYPISVLTSSNDFVIYRVELEAAPVQAVRGGRRTHQAD